MAPRYPVISSGKVGDVTDCHLINGVWVGLWLDILSVCMETIETVEPVPVTSHGLLSGRRLCGKNLPIIWYQMSITGPAGQPVNFVIITKLQNYKTSQFLTGDPSVTSPYLSCWADWWWRCWLSWGCSGGSDWRLSSSLYHQHSAESRSRSRSRCHSGRFADLPSPCCPGAETPPDFLTWGRWWRVPAWSRPPSPPGRWRVWSAGCLEKERRRTRVSWRSAGSDNSDQSSWSPSDCWAETPSPGSLRLSLWEHGRRERPGWTSALQPSQTVWPPRPQHRISSERSQALHQGLLRLRLEEDVVCPWRGPGAGGEAGLETDCETWRDLGEGRDCQPCWPGQVWGQESNKLPRIEFFF